MSGLGNDERKTIYVRPRGEKMVVKCAEGTENSVPYDSASGVRSYWLEYDHLVGLIVGLKIRLADDPKYLDQLQISMMNEGEHYTFCLPTLGGNVFNFYCRMEVINYAKEVMFKSWKAPDNEYARLLTMQELPHPETGEVNWRQPKANYHQDSGVPEWEYPIVQGKKTTDRTAAFGFYEPKLQAVMKSLSELGNTPKTPEMKNEAKFGAPVEELKDDLPF